MLELRPNCERCDRDLPPGRRRAHLQLRVHVLRRVRRRPRSPTCARTAAAGSCRGRSGPRGEWRDGTGLGHDPPGTRRRELELLRGPDRRAGAEAPRRRSPRSLDGRRHHLRLWPARIASTLASTSASLVDQFDTEIRSSRSPRQVVAPSQHVPSSCTRALDVGSSAPRRRPGPAPGSGRRRSPPRHRRARRAARRTARASAQQRSTSSATPARPSARSAAHVANPRARRDDSSVKSPPAERPPLDLAGEVRGGVGHRADMHLRMRAERVAGVVRDVQPLVPVAAPRIGELDAVDEVPAASGSPRPTARTRRRRAPRRRARGRRADRRAGRRTRRCSRCRPAAQTIVGRGSGAAARAAAERVGVHRAVCVGRRPPRSSRRRARAAAAPGRSSRAARRSR